MDRHREAHPRFAPTQQTEVDVELALQRAHFRLLAELYRQRRPIAKRRGWPAVRTHTLVVPITAARSWLRLHEGATRSGVQDLVLTCSITPSHRSTQTGNSLPPRTS